jgi:hypothetical protein
LGPRYPENSAQFLEKVLDREGLLRAEPIELVNEQPTLHYFQQLIGPEINAGRPLCAEMRFWDRTHYVAISGYSESAELGITLWIQDPEDDDPGSFPRRVPLDEFRSNYRQGADWKVAFRTQGD